MKTTQEPIQYWHDNKQYTAVPLAEMASPKQTRSDSVMYLVKRKDRYHVVEDGETIAVYTERKLPDNWKDLCVK